MRRQAFKDEPMGNIFPLMQFIFAFFVDSRAYPSGIGIDAATVLTCEKDWLHPWKSHVKGLSLSCTRWCFCSELNQVKLWSHWSLCTNKHLLIIILRLIYVTYEACVLIHRHRQKWITFYKFFHFADNVRTDRIFSMIFGQALQGLPMSPTTYHVYGLFWLCVLWCSRSAFLFTNMRPQPPAGHQKNIVSSKCLFILSLLSASMFRGDCKL